MEPKIETDSLSRIVDGKRIVDSVSIRIKRSEVAALVGPSGAGKTSFLRLLNRLDEPTEGTVYLDGTDYREIVPEDLRRRVGLVPQAPALWSNTVRENVAAASVVKGEAIDEDRVQRLLKRVNLAGFEERAVEDLSGGQRQRVSLARSLYVQPEVLLLDEPTAHLDSETETRVENLLTDLIRDENLTCVVVTHDEAQAERLGHRVVELQDGRVIRAHRAKGTLNDDG